MTLPERIQKLDQQGMLDKVLSMPEHLKEAWSGNRDVKLDDLAEEIQNITVIGMGGSAISGDVFRCLIADKLSLPVFVNRGYTLPGYINDKSLVFVSSYSGNTEETLSAFARARQRGAKIICITSGGTVKTEADAAGLPVFQLPAGYPPRSALVFLTIPLLQSLVQFGLLNDLSADIDETIALLKKLRNLYQPENETPTNIPLAIAQRVQGKLPIIYAGVGLLEVAAIRWRGQFSENAEVLAYSNLFPEMNHNEIVGWGSQKELDQSLQVIYLRDREDHPRIQLRMDIVRDIIEQSSNSILEVWSEGEAALSRLFSVIFTGDLASVYAAIHHEVDPTPVKIIDNLKNTLAKLESKIS